MSEVPSKRILYRKLGEKKIRREGSLLDKKDINFVILSDELRFTLNSNLNNHNIRHCCTKNALARHGVGVMIFDSECDVRCVRTKSKAPPFGRIKSRTKLYNYFYKDI